MKQEKAFLEAFDQYADALYRHCSFRLSDKERAKDVVSDTFMKTWDYLVKGNTIENFKPFLYRTLHHLIIDEYRKKKTESLDELLHDHQLPEGAFDELKIGGLEEMEQALDAKQVPKLLECMPEHYRKVITLRYIDGFMPAEIANVLDMPVNTVSVRIHRGIVWLAEYVRSKEKRTKMKNSKCQKKNLKKKTKKNTKK